MAYKKETDYMALMNKAALEGNLTKAAELERLRNEKIDGEGLSYHKTYVYNKAPAGSVAIKATAVESEAPKKESYSTKYAKKKDKALDAVLSTPDFSYDAKKDPLYAQYEKAYTKAAHLAGEDTLGRAIESTGGLASSYAVTATAQAKNAQMDKLTDKIPELYKLAYDQYLKDIDTKIKQYDVAAKADDTAYKRYTDSLERAYDKKQKERNYALEAGKAAWEQMRTEAELTGVYKNQPTFAAWKYQQDAEAKEKNQWIDSAWHAIGEGIYDDSFAELLGLDGAVLSALATSAQAQKQSKNNTELRDVAWKALENGMYEDWFADVLSLSPENLKSLAAYYDRLNQLQSQRIVYGGQSTGRSTGSGNKSDMAPATYGEIMVAMVESDDPYAVFMQYAPQLSRMDYVALYDAMKGVEYSKNKKKGYTREALLPVTFGEKPTLAPPTVTKDGFAAAPSTANTAEEVPAEKEATEEKEKELPFLFSYIPMNVYDMMY